MENPKPYSITNDVWMVPCRLIGNNKEFIPILHPFEGTNRKVPQKLRNSWAHDEDLVLQQIINLRGPKNWSSIAKELNLKVHNSFPERKGKQCRERWFNKLNPNVIKQKWSEEEDNYILMQQRVIGNKWKEISTQLPGRTENQIKNRWKSLKRKQGKSKNCQNKKEIPGLEIDFVDESYRLTDCMDKSSVCSLEDLKFNEVFEGYSNLLTKTDLENMNENKFDLGLESPFPEVNFHCETDIDEFISEYEHFYG